MTPECQCTIEGYPIQSLQYPTLTSLYPAEVKVKSRGNPIRMISPHDSATIRENTRHLSTRRYLCQLDSRMPMQTDPLPSRKSGVWERGEVIPLM